MFHRLVLTAFVAAGFGTAVPAAGVPLPRIPADVEVGGIPVGGLTTVEARVQVEAKYGQPLRLFHGDDVWSVKPASLGVTASVDAAVSRALAARPGARVALDLEIRRAKIRRYVERLNRRFARPAQDAQLLGLSNLAPAFREARAGRKVDQEKMVAWIARALRSPWRGAQLELRLVPVRPKVTSANYGPIVVIRRGSNLLHLYDGPQRIRSFTVATGQNKYPTPLGDFEIIVKERNPTWNPPDSDWAKDAEPIPPGPGNPLGTRWMGISSPAVGIHGTPDAASLGYSVSHGCIRMAIPEAEWLFEHVDVGTPVFIVRA